MRGLRICPNNINSITLNTSELQLNVDVLDDGVVTVRYISLGKGEIKGEVYNYSNEKIKKVNNFEVIYLIPPKEKK